MSQVFHVVGVNGSGKSTLIDMLSEWFKARGETCAGVDSTPLGRHLISRDSADAVFFEYLPDELIDARPGEQIIRLLKVPQPTAVLCPRHHGADAALLAQLRQETPSDAGIRPVA